MGERLKNNQWTVSKNRNGKYSMEAATLVVLMDVRDELQRLNTLLHCSNFTGIPQTLRTTRQYCGQISARLKQKRRKKCTPRTGTPSSGTSRRSDIKENQ